MAKELSQLPRVRVVEPRATHGSWSAALTHAAKVSNPMTRFGARFAELADKVAMGPAECLVYVARRVAEAKQARDRARWFGGRLVNLMTGASAEYVVISGTVLANALKWLGETVPDDFPMGRELELEFSVALQLDQDLRAKAASEGIIR